jgi:hypothetical protein
MIKELITADSSNSYESLSSENFMLIEVSFHGNFQL